MWTFASIIEPQAVPRQKSPGVLATSPQRESYTLQARMRAVQSRLQTARLHCIMHSACRHDWQVVGHGTATRDMTVWGLHVQGPFLAGYTPVESPPLSYGIKRLDHAVGNVPKLRETLKYIAEATGFHEFAEFSAEVRSSAV